MPEENFEQQARKLAESFAMEPKPAVWQQVQAAIAPRKRRRRALLWWWLLPLCAAGGLSFWLMNNAAPVAKKKPLVINETSKKNDSEKQHSSALNDDNKKALQRRKDKKNESVALSHLPKKKNEGSVVKKEALRMNKKEATSNNRESKSEHGSALNDGNKKVLQRRKEEMNDSLALHLLPEKKSEVLVTKKEVFGLGKKDQTAYRPADVWRRKEKKQTLLNGQLKMHVDTTETSNKQAALSVEKKVKPYNEYTIDSLLIVSLQDTLAATDSTFSKAVAARVLADSAQHKKDTSAVAEHQKKKIKYAYSLGVLAELGTASLGNQLLGNNEKISRPAAFAVSGSVLDLNTNSGNATVTQYSIKNGVDLSLGLSVQKKLSKSIRINGQMAYRYQQFGISQTVFLDTTTQNTTGSPSTGSGGIYYYTNATERLHFANIYTGIGWQFFTKKKSSLSLQAGIDNSFLLSITQKQKGQADTIKNIAAHNFYQWQPFIHFSLPFDWYAGRQAHFELSPFVRFGVRRFQKNVASSNDNHLSSAGVQMLYFFK